MASSRQRLINASSFLSNQKEKIGGLNVKRSTISGDAFKKGTALEKRVGINEKKITLLKNIGSLRKDNQKKQFNSPLLESLQSIASTVGSIRDTLIQQQDNDKSVAESMRREKEEKERKDQEKGLEAPKPLQKMADKVIAPVMSLWSKILKFITTIFLGKILMNFLDWFGNPENQGKITTLIRFVKDWWPALVGAVVLFGTGFGGLVTGLTVAIASFIPKMLAAITALKASKLAGLGGKAGLIKGGLLVGAGVLAGMGISKMMDKGDGEDVSKEKVQGLFSGGEITPQTGEKIKGAEPDTQLIAAQPGEIMMSKPAVDKIGADKLLAMNAAAGGTNRPNLIPLNNLTFDGGLEVRNPSFGGGMGLGGGGGGTTALTEQAKTKTFGSALRDFFSGDDGKSNRQSAQDKSQQMSGGGLVQGFQGGGLVTVKPGTINSYQDAIDAGIQVEDTVAGNQRFGSIRWLEKHPRGLFGKQKYTRNGTKWNLSSVGGGAAKELAMSTEDYVNMKMGWSGASSAKVKSIKPKDSSKSGSSSGILGPISSNVDAMVNSDKYEVKPKEKKNVVVAYDQEASKEQKQKDAPPPGGNDIPAFDVRPPFMTDQDKMMVLGMRV